MLGEGRDVRVVVDDDRAGEALGHHLPELLAVPAAHDPVDRDLPCRHVDRGRDREADGEELLDRGPDALEQLDDEQGRPVEPGVRAVVDGQRHLLLGDDGAPEVAEGHLEVAVAELHAGDEPDATGEGHHLRAPAAARGVLRVDDPAAEQLFDDGRDGRGGEARRRDEFDLGEAAVALDGVDDEGPVGFAERRLGAADRHSTSHGLSLPSSSCALGGGPPPGGRGPRTTLAWCGPRVGPHQASAQAMLSGQRRRVAC